jgi:hypothetical protein
LTTRDTAPLLLALSLLVVAVAGRRVRPPLVVAGTAAAFVWLLYLGLDPGYTLQHVNVLPQRFLDGFAALLKAHTAPAPAFLLGHHWYGGRWWFWPGSMVIKLPVTLLVAWLLGALVHRRAAPDARRRVYVATVPAALLLAAFTMASPVDLGLRYMLPVIALLTVCVAPLARVPRAIPALLLVGSAAIALASVPHSFAFIEPPFHPGYRVGTDGNLDWGQDVYRLQRWARGKRPWIACYSPRGMNCALAVPGARRLGKYGSPAGVHGWVAMSATLQSLKNWDPWLRRLRPVGTINGTILLYHVRAPAPPPAAAVPHRGS